MRETGTAQPNPFSALRNIDPFLTELFSAKRTATDRTRKRRPLRETHTGPELALWGKSRSTSRLLAARPRGEARPALRPAPHCGTPRAEVKKGSPGQGRPEFSDTFKELSGRARFPCPCNSLPYLRQAFREAPANPLKRQTKALEPRRARFAHLLPERKRP